MNVLEYLKDNIVYLDGGMGTLLQKEGLKPGEFPERWNVSHPEIIVNIQRNYFDAGTNIICTNTFGANSLKFDDEELETLIKAAIDNARTAKETSKGTQEKFIALDIGSMGKLLKPFGDFDFDDAVDVYAKTVKIGAKYGADLIYIETMNDSYDTKAALLAAKENCNLPVFVSNAYGEDGKLMTGATPVAMVAMLEGMGADAIGANCSLGPKQLVGVVEEYLEYASVPVLLKPNAGLPRSENGITVYDVYPDEFSDDMLEFVKKGIRIAGGCCGTTPEYIAATVQKTKDVTPVPVTNKNRTLVSSYTHAVEFKKSPILIGERINPTGKKRFKEALRNNDIDYILGEGLTQQEKGAHILDVNVGLPEIDEVEMLKKVSFELQAIIDLPLQIDTTDVIAMEAALRRYNGKAMINSVNGKAEVMKEIFPLVKKYGGLVVCLTLDEDGIPSEAEKRVKIAKKIIKTAKKYGIDKKDLIFDTLAMTVSADQNAALATLEALHTIKYELGCHTSLGVSNISFGLPNRDIITSVFFTLAMENGLSAAIMNPNSGEMMKSYYSFRALHAIDDNCADYIENIGKYLTAAPVTAAADNKDAAVSNTEYESELQRAIVKGLKEKAGELTIELLNTEKPLDIVTSHIIPALDIVGKGFEKKTMYLPQLLMSAEASQCAFEKIKERMADSTEPSVNHGKFVIATVHGDIHDIGKNIVKLMLENYGFEVYDLGKDVPCEEVVKTVVENHAPLVGLSALMTTTVPAMEETIKLLRKEAPWAKVIVGGAVLTQEYADSIGADYYAKDAMATVRYSMEMANANS
ncbi:MAG: homocysteine S-methyltransferase family protein [Lachnospiraceae bacterium]|nr:homocysteine S-methyltransferase family protein [Lachnospiraceae bacterium]